MKPLVVKEAIEAELYGHQVKVWVIGIGINPEGSKDRLFAIIVPIQEHSPPYIKLNSFKNAPQALKDFIAEAEAYFRPLVELPITFDELSDCWASLFGKNHLEHFGTALPFETALKQRGFKCKDSK